MGLIYWFCLPKKIFDTPTSIVLVDRNNYLLGARIATDGQWRFPHNDSVPSKFITAITEYEDRRFYDHIGIDLTGIGRAIRDNYQEGKITSGASTITMQVIRMSTGRKGRSIYRKMQEMMMATRMELTYTKDQILALYTSNAPFGGNVVGLDAAAWRYYGKSPLLLSWGEAATLAVLPNSPGLVHPGKNRQRLLEKRNRLLSKFFERGLIDSTTAELAKEEYIPEAPLPLPRLAPHLLSRIAKEQKTSTKNGKYAYFQTTLDSDLQIRIQQLILQQHQRLKNNGVHNISVLVSDTKSGEVLSYWGNVIPPNSSEDHGQQVDIITAARSTGSILKPFLYASMLHNGSILPHSLVPDIPMYMGGYRPQNFHENYDGLVPASRALVRSLNIPMVRMLQQYGTANFCAQLKKMGLTTISKSPKHYGLSLILGGAEATLWDLCGAYASMGRTLLQYQDRIAVQKNAYSPTDFRPLHYLLKDSTATPTKFLAEAPVLNAASIYNTFEIMRQLERPNSEGGWKYFESSRDIAWKTGTSFGFRDAWAIGVTPEYTIGVWVGNASGEGKQGLIGVKSAAPILFDVFNQLPHTSWFAPPKTALIKLPVCKKSGFRPSPHCEIIDTVVVGKNAYQAKACSFHQLLYLDSTQTHQVNGACESVRNMVQKSWFVLPPLEEYYYKNKNPGYRKPPEFRADCRFDADQLSMQFIYPKNPTTIFIPVDFDGKVHGTVFKIAHQIPKKTVYWHLDNEYLGMTKDFHEMELKPKPGKHKVVLVDEDGVRIEQLFDIVLKEH
jgi:penicillin-binding protein 1C